MRRQRRCAEVIPAPSARVAPSGASGPTGVRHRRRTPTSAIFGRHRIDRIAAPPNPQHRGDVRISLRLSEARAISRHIAEAIGEVPILDDVALLQPAPAGPRRAFAVVQDLAKAAHFAGLPPYRQVRRRPASFAASSPTVYGVSGGSVGGFRRRVAATSTSPKARHW